MNSNNTKPVIVFDVNETLLDMAPLKNNINSLLEEPQAFRFGLVWYCTILW
jgi:2-haloacid dehalogenase